MNVKKRRVLSRPHRSINSQFGTAIHPLVRSSSIRNTGQSRPDPGSATRAAFHLSQSASGATRSTLSRPQIYWASFDRSGEDHRMFASLLSDLRYALRQMRRGPVLTVTVMLTLGLGIGATTAIFSLIHAVMLKSLPVADPNRLYRIGTGKTCCYSGDPQGEWGIFSYDFYQRLRRAPAPVG